MVFLRNTLTLITFLLCLNLSSQSNSAINQAFSKSYTLESELKYTEAADALMEVYLPESYEFNLRLGWLNYGAKNYAKSSYYYSTASEVLPYSVEAMLAATLPASAMDAWDDVLALYMDVLKIDAKNTTALYNAGLINYNRGEFNNAFSFFNELHNLYPTDYNAMIMHGWTSLKIGKVREAKVIFNQVLLLYPNDESATSALEIMK
jgi:tetratricopeptide (TPR) repeat protein